MLFETPAVTPQERRLSGGGLFTLCFGGGSRGNPVPGGSVSVVVRVDSSLRQAHILWTVSIFYKSSATTTNQAEYWGLIHGLRYAHKHQLQPLEVVGDSLMIIQQQRAHILPNQPRLAELFRQTRRVADTLSVIGWRHHYRTSNKMVDKAANLAMDNGSSSDRVADPTT